ncbi:MAG: hypothetical protein ACYDD1_13680 [Caulobacteraceae bacterium]
MSLTVANRLIQGLSGLSEHGRLALAFIDGGVEWVQWAVNDPAARYALADESALLAAIQEGLHDTPYTLLPHLGLMISPVKLLTLTLADLTTLAKAEGGDTTAAVTALTPKIFTDHKITTQAELAAGQANLADLGVADAAVFQALSLPDRVALAGLLRLPDLPTAAGTAVQKEAAAFGVAQARSPMAFVDFYLTYLYMTGKSGAPSATVDQRLASANTAMTTLQPLLLGALDCPKVDGLVAPSVVAAAVKDWLMMGRQVGFSRVSQGVLQIVKHSTYTQETGDDARRLVATYLMGAQALLASTAPSGGFMGQDGASSILPLETADHQAELHLGPAGDITLSGYRRKPAPTAASPPASAKELA